MHRLLEPLTAQLLKAYTMPPAVSAVACKEQLQSPYYQATHLTILFSVNLNPIQWVGYHLGAFFKDEMCGI
jgi:hypothetical protein